jgi:hypothetical protein
MAYNRIRAHISDKILPDPRRNDRFGQQSGMSDVSESVGINQAYNRDIAQQLNVPDNRFD